MTENRTAQFYHRVFIFLSFLPMILSGTSVVAKDLTIAVASNFSAPMKKLITDYEKKSGHRVRAAFGSSGKLFNQVQNGAPFAAFFSADQSYIQRLIAQGKLDETSRFTYAIGQLVLWSAKEDFIDYRLDKVKQGQFNYIAIANPKFAPYGKAAMEVIDSLDLAKFVERKLVVGENIMQAYQFVSSGNADLGLVALSQVYHHQTSDQSQKSDSSIRKGSSWQIPSELYQPILQDAAILSDMKDNEVIRNFFDYLRSDSAKASIISFGYLTSGTE